MTTDGVTLTEDVFGELTIDGSPSQIVKRFTWKTRNGMTVQVISYGATITSVKVPGKSGDTADVVMGFDDMPGYRQKLNPYIGATIGRVANGTGGARFTLNGKVYHLSENVPNKHLHGGFRGFDKVNWSSKIDGSRVVLSYESADGEEGYPGCVQTDVVYDVTPDNRIKVRMTAKTTSPTPVNLTNHSYFNLSGHDTGPVEILKHVFTFNADGYTPLNEDLITTGEIKKLSEMNLARDITEPTRLSDVMSIDGFDINFCIKKTSSQLNFVARATHPDSGRTLEMYGNQPGVQFYTSNYFPVSGDKERLMGKNGAVYIRHGAFCLEPQNYPNAVNHPSFPNSILNPGEEYTHDIVYKFIIVE